MYQNIMYSIYIYKRSVCLFVCLSRVWQPNYWMDLNQIWHEPPPGPCRFYQKTFLGVTPQRGYNFR